MEKLDNIGPVRIVFLRRHANSEVHAMIITILAAILAMFTPANSQGSRNVIVFLAPIGSTYGYVSIGVCMCDECCHAEAVKEYADEFTALFNSYEVKRAKNGALMIRQGNSGSYRFAKKGN